jgi:hypothetical protein
VSPRVVKQDAMQCAVVRSRYDYPCQRRFEGLMASISSTSEPLGSVFDFLVVVVASLDPEVVDSFAGRTWLFWFTVAQTDVSARFFDRVDGSGFSQRWCIRCVVGQGEIRSTRARPRLWTEREGVSCHLISVGFASFWAAGNCIYASPSWSPLSMTLHALFLRIAPVSIFSPSPQEYTFSLRTRQGVGPSLNTAVGEVW